MSLTSEKSLDALLDERRTFPPPEEFRRRANWNDPAVYDRAAKDPEGFWAEEAKHLDWFAPWQRVLEWNSPWAKWFVGGKLNVTYNCVDRHAHSARRNKAAIIWEGEPGDSRVLTFGMLEREVNRFANALKSLGTAKGDRVAIYMGMVPELAIAMLACAKIGAAHSVVFGGFSAEALRERINDAKAKVVITADGAWRRGVVVPLKASVDEALTGTPTICCSSYTQAARQENRKASCIRPPVIFSAPARRIATSSTSKKTTSSGVPPTSVGSRAIPTSCTARWPTAQ